MEPNIRKLQLEKKIHQELYEIKKLEVRAAKSNEEVLVRRISENYKKAGLSVDFKEFQGPYTFRSFEKYLCEQLNLLRKNRRSSISTSNSAQEIEKLADALQKMNATKLPFIDEPGIELNKIENSELNKSPTNRCFHSTNAYSGVSCQHYVGKGRKPSFMGQKFDAQCIPTDFETDPLLRSMLEVQRGKVKAFEVQDLLKDQELLRGLVEASNEGNKSRRGSIIGGKMTLVPR